MKQRVFRIQDSEGRGPFKPGMTELWIDKDRTYLPKAQIREQLLISKIADPDLHLAFVCTSISQLKLWVSKTEYERLIQLGYQSVKIDVDKIWELDGQAIAGRKKQYRKNAYSFNLY